ncbi:MAG TPA: hypothetical protein VGR92_14040 [Steroidobacteraceae bacterium]|nr:hypothetical protein [Steroidobacteraceae bacterium]
MKRTLAVVVGVSVAAATAWPLVSRILTHPHQPDSAKAAVALSLKQLANCMYQALRLVPGVNQPVLRYKNADGWNHPVLGYLSPWWNGVYQITFEAKRPMAGHDRYWFLAEISGPVPLGVDSARMESVIKNWKTKCNADVEYEIN